MAVTPSYKEYILEQLERAGINCTSRNMFGGVSIFYNNKPFSLISNDELYFKVNDKIIEDFINLGSKAFSPFGTYEMKYYSVPENIIEDIEELRNLINKILEII